MKESFIKVLKFGVAAVAVTVEILADLAGPCLCFIRGYHLHRGAKKYPSYGRCKDCGAP